ncbi:MAG: DJ-1/PfpI family protein [Candidatus Heimdallarchaeota archaeon]|nr:DJ-1/PfpI family protein [Candidatus Heimdallarchaeota archaeon]
MRIAFIIFNGMTTLDFIGVYDPIIRLKTMGFLPTIHWDICSFTSEVRDINNLAVVPTRVRASLANYDLLIVPGGFGTRKYVTSKEFLDWLKTSEDSKMKSSVCTGALLLGAAGFLKGQQATTHPSAFEELAKYCPVIKDQRIVESGNIITARGVTASIDLGLFLSEKLAGESVKEQIRKQMDYPYDFREIKEL